MTKTQQAKRTITGTLVVACLAALVVVAPSDAVGAVRRARSAMAGTTTISGSKTSAIRVTIPRDATISNPAFKGKDVAVDGKGRFAGFALIEDGYAELNDAGRFDSSPDDGVALFGGRIGGEAPTNEFLFSYGKHHPAVGTDAVVPAGDYMLYLIADGNPISVKIKLHGLPGTTRLRLNQSVDFALKTPAPDLGGNGATQVYSAGATAEIKDNAGLLFMAVSERRTAHVNSTYQFCTHYGRPEPHGFPLAYGPGCPGTNEADIFPVNGTAVAATPHSALTFSGSVATPREWGQGVTTGTVGLHEEFQFFALWLSFRD